MLLTLLLRKTMTMYCKWKQGKKELPVCTFTSEMLILMAKICLAVHEACLSILLSI